MEISLSPSPPAKRTRVAVEKRFWLWFVLSLFVTATSWTYVHYVQQPWSDFFSRGGILKTQMWDVYPRWVGTRELLRNGRNPYGPEVTHEIQMAYYGRALTAEDQQPGHKPIDEQRFAYPIYVVFLMAPTIFFDFATVQRWAPPVLAGFAALAVICSLKLLKWRLPFPGIAALILFTISSPQIVQGIHHQQPAVLVGFLLVAGALCVARDKLVLGGAVLALSTIKPQMALLPLVWFFIWTIGDWGKRWRLLASFAGTLFLLVAGGEWLLRGWLVDFFDAMNAYRRYFPTTSVLRLALGDLIGEVVAALIIGGLLVMAWKNRSTAADSEKFVLCFCAFLMGAVVTFPLLISFSQVLLVLPALVLLHEWDTLPRPSRLLFIVVIAWPWLTTVPLLIFRPPLNAPRQLVLLPSLLVQFVPLMLPLLMIFRKAAPGRNWAEA